MASSALRVEPYSPGELFFCASGLVSHLKYIEYFDKVYESVMDAFKNDPFNKYLQDVGRCLRRDFHLPF